MGLINVEWYDCDWEAWTIATTCDIKVTSSLGSDTVLLSLIAPISKMHQILSIWHSQMPPKMGCVGRVKSHSQPCSEKTFFTDSLSISSQALSSSVFAPTKLLPQTHHKMQSEPLQGEEVPQGTHKGAGVHLLQELNMSCSKCQAHENKFPALCICYSSSSLPSLHHPRSKDIKAYIVEGGSNFCSVYRKVCHLLFNMEPRSFLHVTHKPTRLGSAAWLPQGSLDDLESLMVQIFVIVL